jgi:alpha-1,2-mannosyltransferase
LATDTWVITLAAGLRREALTIAAIVMLVGVSVGGLNYFRDANRADSAALFGNDYVSFYAAGRLALAGHPEQAYARVAHDAMQRQAAVEAKGGGNLQNTYYFGYPPTYLSVITPFALLPYYPSLFVFQAITAVLYMAALWLIWPGWRTILFALAAPGACIAFGFGQNAFLTAGLVGLALVLLDRRPILAGVLIGCLAIKPQLGLAFPVVLVATLRWRAFAAAVATFLATVSVSLIWPGIEAWRGFASLFEISRSQLLENSRVGFDKIQSLFAALRLYDFPIATAYLAQAALAAAVAALLVTLWRSRADYRLKAAAAAVASLLMTPFCLAYDLLIEVPAAAFFIAYGSSRGFRSGEMAAIAVVLLSPLISATSDVGTSPVGFAGLVLFYALIVWRGWTDLQSVAATGAPERA